MYNPKKFDFKYLKTDKKGRKVKELSEEEKEIIREAKMKYKLGARRLEKVIEHLWHSQISVERRLGKGRTKEKEKEKAVRKV
ncbi:MAG: hypothetical protein DRO98_07020 [Archaeoglobales archaeon]|nr:MAG: hypothetical protein DRO98_07020 [Archaeoglobales archaeon]